MTDAGDVGRADTARCAAVALVTEAVLVGGSDIGELRAALHPDVTLWSPNLFARSRESVLAALLDHEGTDDTLSEIHVVAGPCDVTDNRAYVEWRLTARFSNPCFVDDDLLIEPHGHIVETSGVLVLAFAGDAVTSVHCYYDDLALLEQLLSPAGRAQP